MDKARETALKALHEVNEKGAYANVALARSLRVAKLSEVDRRFATELVYGAAKAGGTLDWILRRYLNRPLSKIPPMVRDILRLGIYQLFFLARVPASASTPASEPSRPAEPVSDTTFHSIDEASTSSPAYGPSKRYVRP